MEEIIEENKKLTERVKMLTEKVKELELLLQRKSSGSSRAYDEIRAMIIKKVDKEVEIPDYLEGWQKKDTRQRAERQIMSDLKWDLRIRRIQDFRDEHIVQAKEYIENYILPEELKKSKWIND